MTAPEYLIHQAFFGWSTDVRQLTLLASSFTQEADAGRWLHRLANHLRLLPVPEAELSNDALSYFQFNDGWAAVLRRVNVGDSPGRNNSHALIGPASCLSVPVALGLDCWSEWQDYRPPGGMQALAPGYFDGAESEAARRLRPVAEEYENELRMVLARLLDNPVAPLSIIGCPDEVRLAMVWGLHEAANGYLWRQRCNRPWTFSTYADRHEDAIEGLPAIVFLPADPQSNAVVSRTIVDLSRVPPQSRNLDLASKLLARLLHSAAGHIDESMRGVSPPGEDPHVVSLHSGRDGAPADRPTHDYDRASPDQAPAQGDGLPAVIDGQLKALRGACSLAEFRTALRNLEELAQQEPSYRDAVRTKIDIHTMNSAAAFVEIAVREELLGRLLRLAYGTKFEELSRDSGVKHAARLVREGQSEQLVMMLAKNGGRFEEIREAWFERWADAAGTSTLVPTGQLARSLRSARRARFTPVLIVVATAALLFVVFLLGYVAGRPPTSTQSTATTGAPGPAGPTTGRATVGDLGQNRQVFGFIKVGGQYYPQAPCTPASESMWQCRKVTNPTGASGVQGNWVAIAVPESQVGNLEKAASRGEPVSSRNDWGSESPVVT